MLFDTIQRDLDFVRRHGGESAKLQIRDAVTFPTGATILLDPTGALGGPIYREPDPDPAIRLRVQIDNHRGRLERAEQSFHDAKAAKNIAAARHFADVVQDLRMRLTALDREYSALPEVQQARAETIRRQQIEQATQRDHALHRAAIERELEELTI